MKNTMRDNEKRAVLLAEREFIEHAVSLRTFSIIGKNLVQNTGQDRDSIVLVLVHDPTFDRLRTDTRSVNMDKRIGVHPPVFSIQLHDFATRILNRDPASSHQVVNKSATAILSIAFRASNWCSQETGWITTDFRSAREATKAIFLTCVAISPITVANAAESKVQEAREILESSVKAHRSIPALRDKLSYVCT